MCYLSPPHVASKLKNSAARFPALLGLLAATLGWPAFVGSGKATEAKRELPLNNPATNQAAALAPRPEQGRGLFQHNCASCHGEDARGDEGPDLHALAKSDARIRAIIQGGIKGEMPAFGKKFNEAEVQALVTYLRGLA